MASNKIKSVTVFISNPAVDLILRLFLGGTFILSAVSKLPHHTEFVNTVKGYDLLPEFLATAYGNALPWVELFAGVYILLGIWTRYMAGISILMAVSFMIANISSIAKGESRCGSCFGETFTMPVWQAMTIDILIILAALTLLLAQFKKPLYSLDRWLSSTKTTGD